MTTPLGSSILCPFVSVLEVLLAALSSLPVLSLAAAARVTCEDVMGAPRIEVDGSREKKIFLLSSYFPVNIKLT